MITQWTSNAARNFVMHRKGGKTYKFDRGRFTTADKDEIKTLLSSTEFKRDDIQLQTPMELVNEYLEGGEPDKLNEEILEQVNTDGLRRIADHLNLKGHGGYASVIRIMANGKYIDDTIAEILEAFKADDAAENLFEDAKESGVIYYDKPWYKFKEVDAEENESQAIGRSKAEVEKWCVEHKSQVKTAIDNAKDSESK
jgi:hypothetical protein